MWPGGVASGWGQVFWAEPYEQRDDEGNVEGCHGGVDHEGGVRKTTLPSISIGWRERERDL